MPRGRRRSWLDRPVAWQPGRLGGRVVAADINTQFLTGLADNIEVRPLDIRIEAPEPDTYDVVHCRALLTHLRDPLAALRRMAAALRPGGVLLAEEPDYGLTAFSGHPDAEWATNHAHRVFAVLSAAERMHPYLGRRLPGMIIDVGLEFTDGEIESSIARFGDLAFEIQQLSMDGAGSALVAAGIMTEAEHARATAVMSSPSTVLTTVSLVATWGRRPST